MKIKKENLSYTLFLGVIVVLSVGISIMLGFQRNIYHIDEVWSFGLSNSTTGKFFFEWWSNGVVPNDPLPSINAFFEHWHEGSEFKHYITVQGGERFRYDIPYHYQETDVSPPLYYMMIHTICSFFPEQFSKWFGLVPNILFLGASIIFLYLIAEKVLPSQKTALLATAFWAFSRAAFSDVMFIRMYMLCTLEVLISFWLHLQWIENKESPNYHLLIPIFAVNVLGFLTQNYVYVVTFFMALLICIILLTERKWKQLIAFGLLEVGSVLTAFLAFPPAISQLTHSGYAENSKSNFSNISPLHGFLKILLDCVYSCEDATNDKIVSLFELVAFAGILFAVIFFCVKRWHDLRNLKFIFLTVVCIITGGFVSVSNPVMPFFQHRYYFMFLPLCFLLLAVAAVRAITVFIEKFNLNKNIIVIPEIALIIITILGNFGVKNYFLFYERGLGDLENVTAGQTCFVLTNPSYLVHNHAAYFQNADRIYYARDFDEALLGNIQNTGGSYFFVSDGIELAPEQISNALAGHHEVESLGHFFLNEGSYNIYYLSPVAS
ncbi:MAG: glycosyltransferase family 39 protein [Oscillospiraceae bacterium]